ncbi:hypothetical protein BJ912DRAFT_961936 [Pholiota molesta]|nr:hypothetical protein BJ912DRAFT_961936 [Pholiota molesta]
MARRAAYLRTRDIATYVQETSKEYGTWNTVGPVCTQFERYHSFLAQKPHLAAASTPRSLGNRIQGTEDSSPHGDDLAPNTTASPPTPTSSPTTTTTMISEGKSTNITPCKRHGRRRRVPSDSRPSTRRRSWLRADEINRFATHHPQFLGPAWQLFARPGHPTTTTTERAETIPALCPRPGLLSSITTASMAGAGPGASPSTAGWNVDECDVRGGGTAGRGTNASAWTCLLRCAEQANDGMVSVCTAARTRCRPLTARADEHP